MLRIPIQRRPGTCTNVTTGGEPVQATGLRETVAPSSDARVRLLLQSHNEGSQIDGLHGGMMPEMSTLTRPGALSGGRSTGGASSGGFA